MAKKLCIMHSNCQGEPLEQLLMLSPSFVQNWIIRRYTNYTKEDLPPEAMQACDLFLYQHLGEEWGALSSTNMLGHLPASAGRFCLPNMFFKGYWPFWTNKSPMSFADKLLDTFFASGLSTAKILDVYLNKDVFKFFDVEAAFAESLEHERQKEQHADFQSLPFILDNWRKRPLFYTVNHPGTELLRMVANAVLCYLSLAELSAELDTGFTPDYADFHLPIHPQVAVYYGLNFADATERYMVFGRYLSFAEYVLRYLECRKNGLEYNFLGYLQLV